MVYDHIDCTMLYVVQGLISRDLLMLVKIFTVKLYSQL